jgi:hypothetical protein
VQAEGQFGVEQGQQGHVPIVASSADALQRAARAC